MSLSRVFKSGRIRMISEPVFPREEKPTSEESDVRPEEDPGLKEAREKLLEQARLEAETIVQKAQEEAGILKEQVINELEETRTQAKKEAKLMKEKGEKAGFAEGLEKGRAQGREEVIEAWKEYMIKAEKKLAHLIQELHTWQDQLPDQVISLSESIARRVITAELEVAPEKIKSRIAQALQELTNIREVLIKVSPQSLPYLEDARETLEKQSGLSYLRVAAEEDLGKGDFLLETDYGGINGLVDTQLDLIHKELVERWEQDGEDA